MIRPQRLQLTGSSGAGLAFGLFGPARFRAPKLPGWTHGNEITVLAPDPSPIMVQRSPGRTGWGSIERTDSQWKEQMNSVPSSPPDPPGPAVHGYVPHFFMNQKLTAMINRYELRLPDGSGAPGQMIAFAEQKRMKIKEEVYFFTDKTKTTQLFSFKSRQAIDMHAKTDILDNGGNPIAWFEKDFAKSLLRSTWHLHYGDVDATGTEKSLPKAIIRRVIDELPLRFDFDFVDQDGGQPVLSVNRQRTLRDRYEVRVPDQRLAFPVAAAMTVALDAFQGR